MTEVMISGPQLLHTMRGNLVLKIDYVIGEHQSLFGPREHTFYEVLVDVAVAKATAQTGFLSGSSAASEKRSGPASYESLLHLAEGVYERKRRLRDDLAGYLAACLRFYIDYQNFSGKTASHLDTETIANLIHDSSSENYISRIEVESLMIDPAKFSLPDHMLYFKEKGARLLDQAIRSSNGRVKRVINLGARIDQVSYYLANKYKNIEFLSVDFQYTLREQNEAAFGALPDNMHFAAGYGLDLFKAGLSADVVFMMATSVLFSPDELDAYFQAFAEQNVEFIVLNESWASPLHEWDLSLIPTPDHVPSGSPYLGGTVLNSHHNYHRALEAAGYSVLTSKIIDDRLGSPYNILQMVAKR